MHNQKPSALILTETRIPDRQYTGTGVFKGYKMTQHSSSGNRSGGVAIFTKKDLEVIPESVYGSPSGHFAIGCYDFHGSRVIIGGIYGISAGGDAASMEVFEDFHNKLMETTTLYRTRTIIVGGDFNVKLDVSNNGKARTTNIWKDIALEFELIDSDHSKQNPTWRRPNRRQKSRLDYIFYSSNLEFKKFFHKWSRFDHAEISSLFEIGPKKEVTLKDWVLASEDFLDRAPVLLENILLDHDERFKDATQEDRQDFIRDRTSKEYEDELRITDKEEGITNAHILLVVITELQGLQKRIQKEASRKRKAKLQDIRTRLSRAYQELDSTQAGSDRELEVQENIASIRAEISNEAEVIEMASRVRIENFTLASNGKNKAQSFYITKERKTSRNISKLVKEDGQEITEPAEIVQELQDRFCDTVGQTFEPSATLEDFLEQHGVVLPEVSEAQRDSLDQEFTFQDVKKALSNSKGTAPGPTGQTASLYKYIFSMIPNTFVKALNELAFVPGLIDSPTFIWLKDRKVVYIPKPGKTPDRVGNLRPLSLLESLYKIQTRVLSDRLSGVMDEISYPDQHGFRRGLGIQTASLPVLEAVRVAELHGTPMQILSVDLKSAFDTISPQLIYKVMELEKFPTIYMDAMHQLTGSGTGRVFANSILGPAFSIGCGTGQGDPPSAGRFNVGSDPLLRALNLISLAYRYTHSNGLKVPTTGFADDHLHPLKVENAQQVQEILTVYSNFQKVSGLKVNIAKTTILGINTPRELLDEIAELTGITVVTEFRYLGLQIKASYAGSRAASYEAVHASVQRKFEAINSSFADLFHRRQLLQQVFIPSFNHIFMAFGHDPQWGEEIDKMILKLLWTKKRDGRVHKGRTLVAKKRLTMDFTYGGFKVFFSKEIAEGLVLNTLQRLNIQQNAPEGQKTFLAKLMDKSLQGALAPSLKEMFQMAGSKIWQSYGKRLAESSPFLGMAFQAMGEMMLRNEKSREGWMSGSIAGNHMSPAIYRITAAEGVVLYSYGIDRVSQLCGINDLNGRIDLHRNGSEVENGNFPEELVTRYPFLVLKCNSLRGALAGAGLPVGPAPQGPFLKTCLSGKFSSLYRKLFREEQECGVPGPPSYFTRRGDGIPVPALHKFMQGYKNLFKLNIPSKTLTNSFLVMNRQIWTNQKMHLSTTNAEEQASALCGLCGEVENTMHLLFECARCSEPIWETVGEVITALIRRTTPTAQAYRIHAHSAIYNIYDGQVPRQHAGQIMAWFQEIKRDLIYRRYKRCTGRTIRPDRVRLLGYLTNTLGRMISLYRYQGRNAEGLKSCRDTLTQMIQTI